MRIGIDIVDIGRFQLVVKRTPRLLQRVFTDRERDHCMAKGNPYPSLAARFAALEALRKLHPDLSRGIRFQEVEVTIDEWGRPGLVLCGNALQSWQTLGFISLDVSLSHSREQAIAAVIAKRGEEDR